MVEAEYGLKKHTVDELDYLRKRIWNRIGVLQKEMGLHQSYRTGWRKLTFKLLKKAAVGDKTVTAVEKAFKVDGFGGTLTKKTGHRPGEFSYSSTVSRTPLSVHF